MITKPTTICMLLLVFSLSLQAQLRLNVAGNAAIQGNLVMGAPEGSINGLDQLAGFNDLRFSVDAGASDQMYLSNVGNLGIGTTSPNFKLHISAEDNTVIGLQNTSAGGKTYGLYSLGAADAEGAGAFMIRDETTGNNRFFINPSGSVGIGTNTPADRLQVINSTGTSTAISGVSSSSTGVFSRGIVGITQNNIAELNVGTEGQASGTSAQNFGLYGQSFGTGALVNFGTVGLSYGTGANDQFGIYGWITGSATGTRYAVYGNPAGTEGTLYAGYFAGDVTVTGTFDNTSDEKLKKNIKTLDKAMDRIIALNPVRYEFRTNEYPQMKLAEGQQMGLIAQEVERIFPELVKDNYHPVSPKSVDENGYPKDFYPGVAYKGLNYLGLIPVLIKGTQEQQEEIDVLQAENAELKERLARLERVVEQLATNGNTQTVPITDGALRQNQPNPFTEITTIQYSIPSGTQRAELRISDVSGRVIKSIVIDQRGEGRTRLEAQSLSPGTYMYSLVLDGRILDTKKMVLTGN